MESSPTGLACELCGYAGAPSEVNAVRSNIRKFKHHKFNVWRCARCASLHCEEVGDLAPYYAEYPLRREAGFGYFTSQWFRVVLKRLIRAGLNPALSILDYGCGNGLLIKYLQSRGYRNCTGYDPFVDEFKSTEVLARRYDWVLCFDVIEHVKSPQALIQQFVKLLKPEGRLCLFTPRADGIKLAEPEESIHQLHSPCHLHILSERGLIDLCSSEGFSREVTYHRWYQDSWMPCTSRRFIELYMRCQGNDMDSAFDPPRWRGILTTPILWFYALFGYFLPPKKNDTMMIVFKRTGLGTSQSSYSVQ
jgi:SAM-dependent methyltransferase